jgi:conjugative relaxase-like TrwC/TraI family protein
MVATISARGSAKAALAYYDHLRRDEYYSRIGEPPGRWAGESAERLSLCGPVTHTEFKSALNGVDPKTGERLVRLGPGGQRLSGWDMIFSAPKSVSVLWALSNEPERQAIEHAHRSAVRTAAEHLERTWAWARRGRDGWKEQTAGLLMAQFDHHTSRASDPQIHTHCFIFNLAPRWDGSWGAVAGRELYRAQKDAGAVYRRALASELERLDYHLDREQKIFRVAAIPYDVERAFSKRRQAIEEAARAYGYTTAKGMEVANLRTVQAKREARLDGLFKAWEAEAKALGFELGPKRQHARPSVAATGRPHFAQMSGQIDAPARSAPSTAEVATVPQTSAQLGSQLGQALRSLDQPSGMPGTKVRLRQSDREQERD